MSDPISVVDYDPAWPMQFVALRARCVGVLSDLAVAIEHVGSTAVPGLAAKPIIDLDVVIRSESDLAAVIRRLATIGYEHQGDKGIPGREAFRWPDGEPRHHLYVCVAGSPELRRHLAIRDFLRLHPETAKEYAALKRSLAERFQDDRNAYTDGKAEFIRSVLHAVSEQEAF